MQRNQSLRRAGGLILLAALPLSPPAFGLNAPIAQVDSAKPVQDPADQQREKQQAADRAAEQKKIDERKANARQQQQEKQQQEEQDDAAALEERKRAAREKQQAGGEAGDQVSGQRDPAQPAAGRGIPERELSAVKRYLGELSKNRGRVARIDRLKDLAKEAGDTERVNALNNLLRKENERSARQKEAAASAISPETMKLIEAQLARGSGAGSGGTEAGAGGTERSSEGARSKESGAGTPAAKDGVQGARG